MTLINQTLQQKVYKCDTCGNTITVDITQKCPWISQDYGWRYGNEHKWFNFCGEQCEKAYWKAHYKGVLQRHSVTSAFCEPQIPQDFIYDS